jgi:hypothetical protein
LRPHVRTWRSMERRGGRDSGKSVNGAMFGVVTRHFVVWAQTAHSSRTGRVHSTSDAICTARRPRMAGVRGAGPSKTGKRGAKQRTVVPKTWTNCGSGMRCEFLGVNVRFLAREDGCPPPAFSCSPSKKATLNRQVKICMEGPQRLLFAKALRNSCLPSWCRCRMTLGSTATTVST